jgi:hypothetical protein
MTQNLAYVAMTRHRENVQVFGSNLDFWRPEKLPEVLSKSGEKLSAADYLDAHSLAQLMREDDKLITKIFTRLSHELEAMGAISKKAFWQVANHFLGIKREQEIQVSPDFFASVREEVRAEKLLITTNRPELKELDEQPSHATGISFSKPSLAETRSVESSFSKLVSQCEQRLHDLLERENLPLTLERKDRIILQAERTAGCILHNHDDTTILPPEYEMVNFSLRAKYELDRLPQIQQDLMDQGETNTFRAYSIADRLASIEGRLYFEALQKDTDPPFNMSFMAQREFNHHQNELPQLMNELARSYSLSETAAHHTAQDILRYRETHGQNPSTDQMDKMVQITQKLETKDDHRYSYSYDSEEIDFLRSRERDLLLRHGLDHDTSRELDHARSQVNKSLETMQRQIEREREHLKQMDLGL